MLFGVYRIGCTKIQKTIWMAESKRMVSGKLGEKLVCMPTQRYDVLTRKVGRIFVGTIYVELNGVCARR